MFLSSRIADHFEASFFSVTKPADICQDSYLFLLVQKGGILAVEGDETYSLSKDDILLLHPGRSCTLRYLSANQIFQFTCRKNFIDAHIPPGHSIRCNSAAGRKEDYTALLHTMEQIAFLISAPSREYALTAAVYTLLDLLINNFSEQKTSASSADREEDSTELRIEKIRQFIEQNYHLPIYLQTLADELSLSPQYISRFIRTHMGTTFNKYLNSVRMEHAAGDLALTQQSITEIAFSNGFTSSGAFNRQFRETYDITPSAYRKEHAAAEELPEPPRVLSSPEPPAADGSAVREIHISYAGAKSCHPSWRDTINIGVLSNALSAPFHDSLKAAQSEIRFRYVRFHNIFTPEILPYILDQDTWNFTNLDMILDFFREIRLIPFIDLCYKPETQPLIPAFYRMSEADDLWTAEPPLSYTLRALEALLLHCIGRFGHTEVSKWRFEVWSIHDENLNPLEDAKEYWERFLAYQNIIKSLLPDCMVGGPGFNTARDPGSFQTFLDVLQRKNFQPDFVSIYIYCYIPEEYEIETGKKKAGTLKMLSPDPDYPLFIFDRYEKYVRNAGFPDLPVYITEFNSGINGHNYLADSSFQAAFICKSLLDLFRRTDCIAYWNFSDIPGTVNPNPKVYATGMGLIEQHGLPKPGYFSYVLLSKLENRLAAFGKDYIAATDTFNTFQFLVFYYRHYSRNYCCTHHTSLDIGSTYDIFEDASARKTAVHLTGLPKGRYKCMVYTLNRSHGSILDRFIQILNAGKVSVSELYDMLNNMQAAELEYYRKEAKPGLDIFYVNCTDGSLDFDLELEPHEVRLIDLEMKL